MNRLDITGDPFHPEWNYTIRPRLPTSAQPAEPERLFCVMSLVAATGTSIPPADRPILPLSLRPALLAGIAIAERSGPKIITELHGRTIGAYHAHFGTIAASILASQHPIS